MATTAYGTELNERIGFYGDRVFDASALPTAGQTITSSVFRFAETQGGVELAVIANTTITVPDGQTMSVELFWDVDKAGSFTDSRVIYAAAPSGAAFEIAAGTHFALDMPETVTKHYAKLEITTSADQSLEKVDAKLFRVA